MGISYRFLVLMAGVFFLVPRGHVAMAAAQPGYGGGGQTVYCASDNGWRNYCNVDTRGGVTLTRQRSGSACTQGRTWGWDRNGIWVDQGCRAEFIVGVRGGQTIYCASDDGRRNYCGADTSGGVTLTRQRSGSACIQGQTWGYDRRGIWVDRGCRAEFVSGGRGGGGNWGPGPGGPGPGGPGWGGNNGQTFTCSSNDGNRNYCSIPNNRGNVTLTRQLSGSPCTQGQTWGYDRRGVWVDRGCRAEFRAY